MIVAALTFLTPRGALLALAGAAPLAALALASRRERHARAALGLPAPRRRRRWGPAMLVTAIAGLLAVAASQPVLRSTTSLDVRTDAAALFVIDNSRSMLAAPAPRATTRIARAREEAIRLREAVAGIPSGVATMSDRVLPDLLPVPDPGVFEQTVRRVVRVDAPPPSTDNITATSLGALGAVGTQSFFTPETKHRVVVVFTDGESRPFDVHQTARALAHAPGVTPIFIQIWSPNDRVFDPDGQPETAYHPDPSSAEALAGLAQAAGGRMFQAGAFDAAVTAVRAAVGRGPTQRAGLTVSTTALAPYAALAALVPLLLLVAPGLTRGARFVKRERLLARLGASD